jgi:hypothetical protein
VTRWISWFEELELPFEDDMALGGLIPWLLELPILRFLPLALKDFSIDYFLTDFGLLMPTSLFGDFDGAIAVIVFCDSLSSPFFFLLVLLSPFLLFIDGYLFLISS